MKPVAKLLALGLLSTTAIVAQAQVLEVRVWAATCATCHGTEGRAAPGMASLAGKPQSQMEQAMLDFKYGRRPATLMHQIAKGYSDEQIAQIAAYFAAQKP